jgi:hypothetical protein
VSLAPAAQTASVAGIFNEIADIEVALIQVATVFDERAYSIPEKH